MATSGTYSSTVASGCTIELRWSLLSQNAAANTSRVKTEIWMVFSFSTNSSASKTTSVTINGSTKAGTFVIGNNSGASSILAASYEVDIPHNSDGTKTAALSGYADIAITFSGKYVGRASISGSASLTTIPRASTFSSLSASAPAGTAVTFSIARASSSFTHKFQLGLGSSFTSGLIDLGSAASGSYTVPLGWLAGIPSAVTGTMGITLHTYSAGVLIGSISKTVTITAPASVVPTVTGMTVTKVLNGVPDAWGYVQNMTTVRVNITGAVGAYGSTVGTTAYTLKVGGATIVGGNNQEFTLPSTGSVTITGTATDSRYRVSAVRTATINVAAYSPPSITSAAIERSTAAGVISDDGTSGRALVNFTWTPISTNAVTTRIDYRKTGDATWIPSSPLAFANNVAITSPNTAKFLTDFSYDVRFTVTDGMGASNAAVWYENISTAFVTMDFLKGGKGIALGKVASQVGVLEVDFNAQFNQPIQHPGGFDTPQMPNGADFNNYTTPGQWYSDSNAAVAGMINGPLNYAGGPLNQAGNLTVLKAAGVMQFWSDFDYSTTGLAGNTYRRRYYGGVWSPWTLFSGPATILSGTSTWGSWEFNTVSKQQTCWISTSRTDVSIAAAYGPYYLGSYLWTFPRAFTTTPAVMCSTFQHGTGASWGTVNDAATSATKTELRGLDAFSRAAGAAVRISAIATGFAT